MDFGPCFRRGDPLARAFRGRGVPIQGSRPFQEDPRPMGVAERSQESRVLRSESLFFLEVDDFHPLLPQSREGRTCMTGIGIDGAHYDPLDPGF